MGTTSQKLQYLTETKSKIKDAINLTNANILSEDTFRSYAEKLKLGLVDIINNGVDDLYNSFPKTTGTGTEIALNDTYEAPMEIGLNGNTEQRILPVEYTQVDYIESNGTQYVELNYKPKKNGKIISDIEFINTGNQSLFGTYIGIYIIAFGTSANGKWEYRDPNLGWITSSTVSQINTKYNIECYYGATNQYLKVNNTNVLETTGTHSDNISKINAFLFARNNNGTAQAFSSIKLFSFKIYDGDNLILNLIPCYRNSDNEVGLYDLVNNVFYVNQGTDSFTYGNRVPTPYFPQNIRVATGNNTIKVNTDNYPINLGNLEVCYIPDTSYQDYIYDDNGNWYVSKKIGKHIITPTEIGLRDNYANIEYAMIGKPTDFEGYNKFGDYPMYCSHAIYSPNAPNWDLSTNVSKLYTGAQAYYWWIGFPKGTGLDTIKEKLNGGVIYYPLATPTDELITDETLIEQLNALKNAKSVNDKTYISQINEQAPFILDVSALSKN